MDDAEQALQDPDQARAALLDLAIAAAGIGTFEWDLVTGRLSWDARLDELFGFAVGAFEQTIEAFMARLHADDAPQVSRLLQEAIDSGGDYEAEYRVVAPGAPVRWVAARGRVLRDESATAVRLLGAAWDVSARRQAQDRLAQILETMAVGFLALDSDWTITHVNGEGERITGYSRADLLERNVWEAFPEAVGSDFEERYREAVRSGQSVTFESYYPAPLDVWVEVRAVPTPEGLSLYFLDINGRRRVQQAADLAAARERLLSSITEELAATLDADEAVTRLTRLIVPTVADWCIVTLVDDGSDAGTRRGLRNVTSWHADPALRPVADAYAQSRLSALTDDALVVNALRSGQPQVLASGATSTAAAMIQPGPVRDLLLRLAPESVAVLPLPGRDGPVGLLTIAHGAERGSLTPEDLTTARHVAARAGLVLDNARLFRQQREVAEGLQRSLLTPPPEPDHLQIVVRYVPAARAAEVGGDWYDAFLQPAGATVLVIGDVIGHDIAAAAAMGQIRTIVRTIGAEDGAAPAEILSRADRVMETLQTGTAATAVVARLEQTDDERRRGVTRLRWANAGHPPPMAIHPDGTVLPMATVPADRLLGVTPDASRRESEVLLDRGAVVLLYTDGLVERRDQDLDAGLAHLQRELEALAGQDLDSMCDQLLERMLPDNPDDDVALVAVRLHPQDRPRPPEAGPNRIPPNVPDESDGHRRNVSESK
ncbi:SpoIIE family protein phosphatase [Blastococcus sp. SYSU DS0552]